MENKKCSTTSKSKEQMDTVKPYKDGWELLPSCSDSSCEEPLCRKLSIRLSKHRHNTRENKYIQ